MVRSLGSLLRPDGSGRCDGGEEGQREHRRVMWRYQDVQWRTCQGVSVCRWVVGPFVVRRHEVTDQAWAVIGPLLAPPRTGRLVRDRRQVLNGILWKLSTGAAWWDLPERYGP